MTLSTRVFGPTGAGSSAALLATLHPTEAAEDAGSSGSAGASSAADSMPGLVDGGTRAIFADRVVKK
jgi:hypothetical protein